MDKPLEAVGQIYRGFQITKYLPLNELQSTLIELVHQSSGARVIHIANSDQENLFCLGFQTLPDSSNGAAHILEHTVLCGSKRFPIKDPFFSMTRRSLNTFMNALTGQDFTCYPAASQVKKDFYNLLDVYLDAAFYPELKKVSFLQEGHRLEFANPKDPDSPLIYQGVVYNEMKGAMSSSDSRLAEAISKYLTPDLTYAYNSGGDPKEIPSLTYEGLLDFHKTFYHPSRCIFFFYGNLPLNMHLDFIEEKALNGVKKIAPLNPLPLQTRFKEPVSALERYPTIDTSPKNDFIALSWLTCPISSQDEVLALSLLDSLLMDTDASPLKLALLKSGLCKEAESTLDAEMSEIPYSIICKGCDAADGEKLKTFIFTSLAKIAKTPFSHEDIEASLHQLEFDRKEIGAEGIPFGLTLFFRSALLKQHGCEPENGLLIHSLFSELRDKLKDPNYLSNLLKKHLLENPHYLFLTLKGDPTLEKKEHDEEISSLAKLRSKLSDSELKKIREERETLSKYQESIEHQSLDCLPKISLNDIPKVAKDYPLKEVKANNLNIFHHECFTNKIVYADLLFDLPDLSLEDLPLLSLFSRILTELGAGGRDYEENLDFQQAYVGSLSASVSLHISDENPNLLKPTFSLKGKALLHNTDKLFTLFSDFLHSPDFSDQKRVEELLGQHSSSLQLRLVKSSLNYAAYESLSGNSVSSLISSKMNGLPYYQKAVGWAKEFPKTLLSDLSRLGSLILGGAKADLVLSCGKEEFDLIEKKGFFGLKFPLLASTPWKGDYSLKNPNRHARLIPAPVAFTAQGMKAPSYKDRESPYLLIATELFDNCYLHKEVREKGGAYGSGASYNPANGNFYFYSFRDPQLVNTETAFGKALEKIAQGNFSDEELEEAKLGVLQTIDGPLPPGVRAIAAYGWMRTGRTFKKRDLFRKQIIDAKKDDVIAALGHLLKTKKTLITYIGKELFEKEKEKLTEEIPTLPIEK